MKLIKGCTDEGPILDGQPAACIQETTGGGNDYRFYYTLIAR